MQTPRQARLAIVRWGVCQDTKLRQDKVVLRQGSRVDIHVICFVSGKFKRQLDRPPALSHICVILMDSHSGRQMFT